jgi:type II secretory pathway component GspD/PulD (secretin)
MRAMLKINKYRNLMLAIILISLVAIIQGADEPAIDINEITKSNPFTQFTANQNQAPIGATPVIAVKPDLFVETATLKFLDAKSVKTSITSMSSEYGSIEPDSKGNTLIICDTNENLEKILKQIRKIDRKPDQVMIEVVLVDVKIDDGTEIGINWDLLTKNYRDDTYRQNFGFTPRLQTTAASDATLGNRTAFVTTGTGADFILISGDIRNVIHALQEKNNVEILASPRVMVVSGQTASIQAVEEVPYSEQSDTSNGGALTSTQFKNVGVMLKIGATLTDDKYILLNVESEQNVQTGTSTVSGVSGTPIVDTRKIQSSLLLEDGQILVIGGLRRKDTQTQSKQVPILGNIPIIGLAFKSIDVTENSSELLVLLSPHIYKGEKPGELEMKRFNEITQRPLLTIPEADERREKEKKQEAEKIKKEEKARKAKQAREAKK